ncbi:MAG TPA: hypothetical protein VF381_09680 [Thermoanaerobaculia bacterium]
MARTPLLLGTFALAVSLAATNAHATIQRAVDFDEKVDKAAAIVLGKVVHTRSQWDTSHRWILTYSTFTVEQTMKGTAPAEVTVVTPGGTVGDVVQSTIGISPFREGDENVIFVKNTAAGPTVLYFDQGAYGVTEDHGEKMVRPVSTGAVHFDTQRGAVVESEHPRTLRDFARDVHDSIERTRANKMALVRERQRQQHQESSLTETLMKYKLLVVLALIGTLLATSHFFRHR